MNKKYDPLLHEEYGQRQPSLTFLPYHGETPPKGVVLVSAGGGFLIMKGIVSPHALRRMVILAPYWITVFALILNMTYSMTSDELSGF